MIWRVLAVWLVLVVLAILNGSARNAWVSPRLGELAGHVVSTITLSGAILIVAGLTIRWIGPASSRDAWAVGLLWLALTLAFGFLAGYYLFGSPSRKLLADYNLFRGRIWIAVLIATLTAPYWAALWRGLTG